MKLSSLKNKVVVVTGASAGIGRATARMLGQEGAHVALLSRNRERLEEARAEIEEAGGRALVVPTDVGSWEQVEAAGQKILAEFGHIDVWINNAMVSVFGKVADISPEEFKRVTEVTYLGTVYGSLVALRHMLPKNQGTIVQVGSALAYRSIPLQAPYCAAKHAMAGFTDAVRTEFIHDKKNIDVTMVQLPAHNTPQFSWVKLKNLRKFPQPVPPIFQPEVAARAIIAAAKNPKKRERLLRLPTKKVVWAQRLIPWFAEWYAARNSYDEQFTSQPVSPDREDNLWASPPGSFKAHGVFDTRARL